MEKIIRVAGKIIEGAPHSVLLVIDATTGQNAMIQAREFVRSAGVTGIVMTKMDGTAKGGSVISILDDLKLPIKFIGIGEEAKDLLDFSPQEFVSALLS